MLRLGGFLNPYDLNNRVEITEFLPYKLLLPACNGSGKDQYIIAPFAVWFALVGCRNRVIITSSSHDQVKHQTEPYIRKLAQACNAKFGNIFRSVEFYHACTLTASEIKLFATDDPGKAEGYHPWPGGRMALMMNEAKSIQETIFEALTRCTGYAYWLEISSPAKKSGHFYEASERAIGHPNQPQLGKYFLRHVSAYDCPHIPQAHIDEVLETMPESWINSSIRALFSDAGEAVVITEDLWNKCTRNPAVPVGDDFGIGLDTAAGVDENACYVRKGNHVIHKFFFRQKDIPLTIELIDRQLEPWKAGEYTFNADDGGISHAIVDGLRDAGWQINRVLNQSPARRKREFLNRGAEIWFRVRTLLIRNQIILPTDDRKFKQQLTTRYYDQQETQGKLKLESKDAARARGGKSPDRADAFVLCFYGYNPGQLATAEKPKSLSISEFAERFSWGGQLRQPPKSHGIFTDQKYKI